MELKEKNDLIKIENQTDINNTINPTDENLIFKPIDDNSYNNKNKYDVLVTFGILSFSFILILLITFCIFSLVNLNISFLFCFGLFFCQGDV